MLNKHYWAFGIISIIASISLSAQSIILEVCSLSAYDMGEHVFWMYDLPGDPSKDYVFDSNGGELIFYDDGTARIVGTIYNVADSNRRWKVDFRLKDQLSFNDWTTLGRGFKNGGTSTWANRQSWEMFEVDEFNSSFSGVDGTHYAGDTLYFHHFPVDRSFGFQVGVGANDFNGNNGISGWFRYSGSYSGKGDINSNTMCGPPVCDVQIDTIYATCITETDFEITVSIQGNGNNYSIVDSEGNPQLNGLTAGTYSLGPYFNSTDVFVTVSDPSISNCFDLSGPYTADCMAVPICDLVIDSITTSCISANEFTLLVSINGTGSTYQIIDDKGTTPLGGLSAGTYTYGSYTPGSTVMITVEDVNIFGCMKTFSEGLTTDCPEGWGESNREVEIGNIFPNPATNQAFVRLFCRRGSVTYYMYSLRFNRQSCRSRRRIFGSREPRIVIIIRWLFIRIIFSGI